MAAPQADAAQPSNIGRDGPVADMTYYELLEVSASATDLELKKAYRKAAIKYHPDKGGDEDQFKMVGEAYRVLSDSNERANYDKYGTKKPTDEVGVKEATEMFGQLFGGERFTDYIGEVSLLRDFGKASEIMMTDEERKEMEAQVKEAQKDAKKSDPVQQSLDSEKAGVDATSTDAAAAAAAASATPGAESGAGDLAHSEGKTEAQKKAQKAKLTPEQRAKLEELEKEKEAVEKKRIEDLTRKLIDRIRPFCEAKNPGDKDDSETQLFSRKMRDEAEDLKLESFGVELLHVIGNIYLSKSTTWVKTHKSNFLGLPGFLSRLKEKGGMIKETWGLLGSAINVQMSMEELAKRQEKGDIDEEELAKLEQEMSGKMLLATWRTTRWEVTGVLRKVCDNVLNEKGVSDKVLLNRARALAFLGAIYRNVQPDEGDDERRELERLVAEAAQKKKKPKASKKDKHANAVSGAATPAETASPK